MAVRTERQRIQWNRYHALGRITALTPWNRSVFHALKAADIPRLPIGELEYQILRVQESCAAIEKLIRNELRTMKKESKHGRK